MHFRVPAALYSQSYYSNLRGSASTWRSPRFVSAFQAVAQIHPNDRVLDIGCGRGESLVYMADRAQSIVGVDFAPSTKFITHEMLGYGYRSGAVKNPLRATFFGEDICTWVLGWDRTFSLILLLDVLDRIEPDRFNPHLERLDRLLQPGGRLVVYLPPRGPVEPLVVEYVRELLDWIDLDSGEFQGPWEHIGFDGPSQESSDNTVDRATFYRAAGVVHDLGEPQELLSSLPVFHRYSLDVSAGFLLLNKPDR